MTTSITHVAAIKLMEKFGEDRRYFNETKGYFATLTVWPSECTADDGSTEVVLNLGCTFDTAKNAIDAAEHQLYKIRSDCDYNLDYTIDVYKLVA
ncbi:MAG: hypothetical protein ABI606_16360 [Rhodoferax sp.]